MPGSGNHGFRFLLKRMQHVNRLFESNRIDRPICATAVVLYYLDDTSSAEAFQGLGVRMLAAALSPLQGGPDVILCEFREFLLNLPCCFSPVLMA
jgi:hypothetical protein